MTIFVNVPMQKGNQGRERVPGSQTHGKMRIKRGVVQNIFPFNPHWFVEKLLNSSLLPLADALSSILPIDWAHISPQPH